MRAREDETRLLRSFQNALVPGLFQTAEYARAVLAATHASLRTPIDDLDAAVHSRMGRQEALYRADKRLHVVVGESALRQQLVPADVLVGQLDRLIAVAGLPTVRLGCSPSRRRASGRRCTASRSTTTTGWSSRPSPRG